MKRPEELSHMLTEMYNDTKDGKIRWKWRMVFPGQSMNVMFPIIANIRDRIF